MEDQNSILGFYKILKINNTCSDINCIEYGFFLRKNRTDEFFSELSTKNGQRIFSKPEENSSNLIKRLNQEKNEITLFQKHERVLDIAKGTIIMYEPLREERYIDLLAIKKPSPKS